MLAGPEISDGPGASFDSTHWSVVLAANEDAAEPGLAQAALEQLCQSYWAPLYGFVRGRGYSVHDAQDLTQGFFAHLIENRIYTRTDRIKGKFRSFLLAALKNFLVDAYHRERALKRGGAQLFVPLPDDQAIAAEALFQSTTVAGAGAASDQLFERQWAETILLTVLERLRNEFSAEGKEGLFRDLEIFLAGGAGPLPSYDQLAARLGMPAATVRSHVTRLRGRYRALLRAELRRTVDTEQEVDEELRQFLRILMGG